MTPWHPGDEDLILHFYGERADEEARIDEHLHACERCRTAWTELQETLKLVDTAAVPEPDPGFERVMWARIQPSLAPAPAHGRWWSSLGLLPIAGLAASVVAAVVVAGVWSHERRAAPDAAPASPAASTTASASQARERVLLTAAGDHFAQAEVLLVELMNAPDKNGVDLDFERQAASDLVASGRLYHRTAVQDGDVRLAQMLEDLEAVLVEVARSPEHVERHDLDALRARIDAESLLFKVRAVGNEIRHRQAHLTVSEGTL